MIGSVVKIAGAGSGTVFGKKRKGFTIRGGGGGAVLTDTAVTSATISSNVATGNNGTGFIVFGSTNVRLIGNQSTANGFGGAFGVVGFSISGSAHVLTGNVATANDGDGFNVFFGSTVLVGNVSNANVGRGFTLGSGGHLFKGNTAIGNLGSGIGTANATGTRVLKNNVFGNNTAAEIGLMNCGIRNFGGTLDASQNFWGATSGPGADPADDVCNTGAGTTTITAPFASKQFKVKALP